MIGIDPDLTIIIDVSLQTARDRMYARGDADKDRMEEIEGMLEHEHKTLMQLADEFPDRIIKVSGEGEPDEVFERVKSAIRSRLNIID